MNGELHALGVQVVQLCLTIRGLVVSRLETTGAEGIVHDIQCQLVNLPRLPLRQLG